MECTLQTEKPYGLEVAQAILRGLPCSSYLDVKQDGIYIQPGSEEDVPELQWIYACDMDWAGAPVAITAPALPIPFDAKELAAFVLSGNGAAITAHYGDISSGPYPEMVEAFGVREGLAQQAIIEAYSILWKAQRLVGLPPESKKQSEYTKWRREMVEVIFLGGTIEEAHFIDTFCASSTANSVRWSLRSCCESQDVSPETAAFILHGQRPGDESAAEEASIKELSRFFLQYAQGNPGNRRILDWMDIAYEYNLLPNGCQVRAIRTFTRLQEWRTGVSKSNAAKPLELREEASSPGALKSVQPDSKPHVLFQLQALPQMQVIPQLQGIAQFQALPLPPQPKPRELPDPQRRLKRLRELGGDVKKVHGEWTISGLLRLMEEEVSEGRKRSSEKTIRKDLKEAAQQELEEQRAGFFAGLGSR